MYEKLIEIFEDKIDTKDIFNSLSFNFAYTSLLDAKNNLVFIIGVPGVGKSVLMNLYHNLNKTSVLVNGTISKKELDKLIDKYNLILIDEAQLLDIKMIEYIRTIADLKKHKFVLSLHLKEATEILKKEHFKSRSIDIIKLEILSKEEMIQYINSKLIANSVEYLFSKKEFNKIYKYTKGNFRYVKKFIKTLFELLEFASKNNLEKYRKVNNCLITMTALKLGLENG